MNKIYQTSNFLKIFIFFSWIAMWLSINAMPGEMSNMTKDMVTFSNGMRTIIALGFSLFSAIFAVYFLIFNREKLNKRSIIIIIFLIYFLSQLIGLSLSFEREFSLNNTYLIIYSISSISIFYLILINKYENIFLYFLYFLIFILFLMIVSILLFKGSEILHIIYDKNFYYLLHPDYPILNQAPPRITGLSRSVAIINIFFITIYLINYKNILSLPLIMFIFILSIFIWLSQSRGTIICFYLSSAMLIFLFNNHGIIRKFFLYFLITILPIISWSVMTNIQKYNLKDNNEIFKSKDNNEIFKSKDNNEIFQSKDEIFQSKDNSVILNLENSRFYTNRNTSGRTTLWKTAINRFEKKIIFGYGPQADRFILGDKTNEYGNNVSNALVYSFLSGGYLSFICIFSLYIYSGYLMLNFFFRKKLYKFNFKLTNNNKLIIISITFTIFFMLRSLIENSFSVFSIDFLITIFSLIIIETYLIKKRV